PGRRAGAGGRGEVGQALGRIAGLDPGSERRMFAVATRYAEVGWSRIGRDGADGAGRSVAIVRDGRRDVRQGVALEGLHLAHRPSPQLDVRRVPGGTVTDRSPRAARSVALILPGGSPGASGVGPNRRALALIAASRRV